LSSAAGSRSSATDARLARTEESHQRLDDTRLGADRDLVDGEATVAPGVTSLFTSSPVALFFAARSLSVPLLVLSLVFTYRILRRLRCGFRLSLALTGVVGLFPMTSMVASSVQSDNLSFTLVSLALLAALELRPRPHHRVWTAVLGLALGALLVTKVHYFAIVALAILAMLVTQRIDQRDGRGWRLEVALLLLPAIALEAVQVWTQWGAPSLIAPSQLGDVADICLILTLRADFYGRALRHRPLADALQGHVENLGPMNWKELQTAIVRPAHNAGVTFEAGVIETLLDAVQSKPGGLPLLQFALREMWTRQERN